ncbi:MAG TPA: polyprenyl synthetase family protein [Clostridiaceae bacterium]|nr:polyprenyl synthetase family protein [Clostridiaceae bacterium]
MKMPEGQQAMDQYLAKLEEELLLRTNPPDLKDHPVWQAAAYSIRAGGKRIRPELLFRTLLLLGQEPDETATAFAAALEMVHTYSLIHDDLPAMDDDDFRRGQPACHIRFGEARAILAGDLLLNLAYETMLEMGKENTGAPGAMQALAYAAGGRGMILGQDRDLQMEKKKPEEISLSDVYGMAEKKTGCLIEAAFLMAGHLAGAPDEVIRELSVLGLSAGLVFQIRDDILDQEASLDTLGKTPDKDARSGKKTFVTVGGLEGARRALDTEAGKIQEALWNLSKLGYDISGLKDYLDRLAERTF